MEFVVESHYLEVHGRHIVYVSFHIKILQIVRWFTSYPETFFVNNTHAYNNLWIISIVTEKWKSAGLLSKTR